jgi:hypothetical protein
MTLTNAKIVVARSLGGQNDQDELRAAGEAINRAINTWNRNTWDFLRLDNLNTFTVASLTTLGSNVLVLPTGVTFPNFANVYKGTTVSGTGIPAGTTVLAKVSNSQLTLSALATASNDPITLTFSGPIPIWSGQSDYALPYLVKEPSYARLTSGVTLTYARSRFVNRVSDPTADFGQWGYMIEPLQGIPDAANILPLPTSVLRLVSTPTGATTTFVDTLVLEYFREIQKFLNDVSVADEARTLDVPDIYVDALLQLAEYHYMANKDSEIVRTGDRKQSALAALKECIDDDSGQVDDDMLFIPEVDWNNVPRPRRWMDTI